MRKGTISIQVDAQTASALAEYAGALGLTIEQYLKKHFGGANGVDAVADVDHWLDELAEGLPELPRLPQDFSTRDIYADHD
jgi:hypothetical protein